jgi:hypothetical protein
MNRQVAALAFALCLTSSYVSAQTTYTIKETVDVHQAPLTSSPVIGHATRGRSLELTRDVGDWAEVTWAGAASHKGFIRVRYASEPLAAFRDLPAIHAAPAAPTALASASPTGTQNLQPSQAPAVTPSPVPSAPQGRDAIAFELPPHTAGFGLRMDPRFRDFGGAVRLWSPYRVGAQLEVSRSTTSSALTMGHLASWQFSPAVLYALPDVVQSSVWIRPYVGTGLDLVRSDFGGVIPGVSTTDTAFGTRIFGGAEFTLPGAPQVTLSTDVGYHWLTSSFNAFDIGGVRTSIAAHWYIR